MQRLQNGFLYKGEAFRDSVRSEKPKLRQMNKTESEKGYSDSESHHRRPQDWKQSSESSKSRSRSRWRNEPTDGQRVHRSKQEAVSNEVGCLTAGMKPGWSLYDRQFFLALLNQGGRVGDRLVRVITMAVLQVFTSVWFRWELLCFLDLVWLMSSWPWIPWYSSNAPVCLYSLHSPL